MSEDNHDKHNALEEFLEDALNESDTPRPSASIPDQAYKPSPPEDKKPKPMIIVKKTRYLKNQKSVKQNKDKP